MSSYLHEIARIMHIVCMQRACSPTCRELMMVYTGRIDEQLSMDQWVRISFSDWKTFSLLDLSFFWNLMYRPDFSWNCDFNIKVSLPLQMLPVMIGKKKKICIHISMTNFFNFLNPWWGLCRSIQTSAEAKLQTIITRTHAQEMNS